MAAIFFANLAVLPYEDRVVSRVLPNPLRKGLPVLLLLHVARLELAVILLVLVRSFAPIPGRWSPPLKRLALSKFLPLAEPARQAVHAGGRAEA
tara:strand:- start:2785 stop:3066 length:282 start_codon:yes stop_codon:yes gene_type:complete